MFNSLIYYLTISIILICIFIYVWIKFKYKFWSIQPVFHMYDIWYWLFPPGIIHNKKFIIDKYYDYSIKTMPYNKITDIQKTLLVSFIKSHFLLNKIERYDPPTHGILDYFEQHNDKPMITIKYDDNINKHNIISTICSVPITCILYGNKINMHYVDFLCVHKDKRKQGYAAKTIYSHVINSNKYTNIYLFKGEGRNTMIIPLTVYNNYMFDTATWLNNLKFNTPFKNITLINSSNYNLFINLIETIYDKFKCIIMLNLQQIKYLCSKSIIYITILSINNVVNSCYIFKNNYTTYNGIKSIECIGSYSNIDEGNFVYGFLHSYNIIRNKLKIRYLLIENISNNNIIIKNILKKYEPMNIINNKYYFYNFACIPLYSHDILCIN